MQSPHVLEHAWGGAETRLAKSRELGAPRRLDSFQPPRASGTCALGGGFGLDEETVS